MCVNRISGPVRAGLILSLGLVCVLGGTGRSEAQPADQPPPAAPAVKVRPDHPRVWMTADDPLMGLAKLRQRARVGRHPLVASFPEGLAGDALRWLLLDDKEAAERALAALRKPIPGPESLYGLRDAGLAFDWLYNYPGFSPEAKRETALAIAREVNAHYATVMNCPAITNGQVRATNAAIAAVATAGDWPGSEKALADIGQKMVGEILGLFDEVLPGGDWPEGLDYLRQSVRYFVPFYEAWRTATGDERILNSPFLRNCFTPVLYKTLPNGHPSYEDDNDNPFPTWKNWMIPSFALGVLQDPYARTYLNNPLFLPEPPRADALPVVLWRSQDVAAKPLGELPPDHFFPGTGDVVMRDGFGEDSRWIGFRCGPYLTKHNHFDQGHFAIYYQGYLAVDTGCWRGEDDLHYRNYCRRTIAHNTMLISWPGEKFSFGDDLCEANDGGQYTGVPDGFPGRRVPGERHYWFWNAIVNRRYYEDRKGTYDTGTMLGLESDGKSYACARGDATKAYNEAKIGHFYRTLLYLKPDLLLVYDQVASKITEGWLESYCEKTWLLHCMEEPQVEGEVLGQGDGFKVYSGQRYAVTQGHGRLNVATLLPAQTTTTVRGGPGFEFWVDGKNYPVTGEPREPKPGETWGAWRLEVRTQENRAEDLFLHLIRITEKDQESLPEHTLIDSETVVGVLLPQQAALFVKSPTPPATVRFTLARPGKVDCYLSGLAPRKPFTVATGGRKCAEGTAGEVGLARFAVDGPGEFTVTTE